MATTYYGAMREPLSREAPPAPSRCDKCNSTDLSRAYHRDLLDCIAMHQRNKRASRELCGGDHLHWQCRDCGHDFTSPCANGSEE